MNGTEEQGGWDKESHRLSESHQAQWSKDNAVTLPLCPLPLGTDLGFPLSTLHAVWVGLPTKMILPMTGPSPQPGQLVLLSDENLSLEQSDTGTENAGC